MHLRFNTKMLKIHYSKLQNIHNCVWVVKMKNLTQDKFYFICTCDAEIKYFLNRTIYDSNKLYGCLYLNEETPRCKVK